MIFSKGSCSAFDSTGRCYQHVYFIFFKVVVRIKRYRPNRETKENGVGGWKRSMIQDISTYGVHSLKPL